MRGKRRYWLLLLAVLAGLALGWAAASYVERLAARGRPVVEGEAQPENFPTPDK